MINSAALKVFLRFMFFWLDKTDHFLEVEINHKGKFLPDDTSQ